jgi:hypothetical protein
MGETLGFVCVAAAVILFGIFSLPTKSHKSGDGLFFQLLQCAGIFFVGGVAHIAQCATGGPCAPFSAQAASGGAIWCVSNLALIPVVNALGVGRAMLIWGSAEMLTGWGTSRFGLFGLIPEPVRSPALNNAGVALGVLSILVLSAASSAGDAKPDPGETYRLLDRAERVVVDSGHKGVSGPAGWGDWETNGYDLTATLPPRAKRLVGIVGSLVAGVLSGSMFTPPQYVCDHPSLFPNASRRLSEHMFSHFTGIFITSVFIFATYAAATRNTPWVSAPLALPAFASGLCWGLATLAWFVANETLSLPVAFPMVTLGPGLVSLLIGGVAYGEVVGIRAAALLGISCALFAAAAVCIGLSGGS